MFCDKHGTADYCPDCIAEEEAKNATPEAIDVNDFDWTASYEFLADQFYKETGMMAPGKDDPFCGDMRERSQAWRDWFQKRSAAAWMMWHKAHGIYSK